MYRGRAPPRGGYPPPFEGRGPPPPRPYPAPGYRDDRNRPRPPYHHDYRDPDSYRRSPPSRRYPSPGSGSHRGAEYWTGGPPRERSPSPREPISLDHKLVITVGNELTGPSRPAPSRHPDRDYPPREYERSRGQSPDRSRAKSRGRSKSRPRSHSRSPDRSRGRSKSRPRSPDRSRGRSKSRPRSPDRSRAKSRGRSKSRPRSRSRSRSRSRGRSRGRSYSKVGSRGRSKSRQRSRSRSTSSSSSSSRRSDGEEKSRKEFRELETARRRKELEETLNLPTKSILKKRNESEDSPSVMSTDSPTNMSLVANQLLLAVKGLEPHRVASMLSELQADPQMAERPGLHAEIREVLGLLGGQAVAPEKSTDDIDDEEKFLYGDSEEPKPPAKSEPVPHQGLDLYGDVTEEALYGDYPQQNAASLQTYGLPPGASSHYQAPSTMGEVDVRYASRPAVTPEQNLSVQVSKPVCPPGTEPLEESERQALEEYEKIQDLLKTIGLDLGVVELTKMAARTKERLQGNKPPPKTPTRRRRYSSGSSDGSRRRRSHSGSSSSSGGRGGSWSSDDGRKKSSAPPKSHKDKDVKETKAEWSAAALPPQNNPEPSPHPLHPGMPIPTYPPPQVPSMIPPNFPPPGYGQYGNYLPYLQQQQWPPMYPPPNMGLPPQTGPDFAPALPYNEPYGRPAPDPGAKGQVTSCVQDGETGSCDKRTSEEQNNESQKQKVLEEREELKQEREIRMNKKEYLMKELERLRKQQGELLRKKRREKGGHKDPLLQEISRLQEEVMTQISNLRREHEAAEKKRSEIEKVALILGLSPSDRPRRTSKPPEEQEDRAPQKEKQEAARNPEGLQAAGGSMRKTSAVPPPSRASPDKPPVRAPASPPEPFEYYDAGNHWCKNCNVTSGSMFDFFTHLHSKTHRKTLDPYDRPWASGPTKTVKNVGSEEKLTKPAKGSEFLLPVRGFFCLLCEEFYGDGICAEEHVTTHVHNEKYKKQMYENPLYEQRRNLDRQAGLASETSAKKRKHDDDERGSKEKEEKPKHKKEKKDKEKKKVEDDSVQKEEERPSKKEDFKDAKSLEEERPSYSKKDEDEKYKYKKKDDKYCYSGEEEEKSRYSRRDEDDMYKYSREEETRYRYRKDRYEGHPKYGPKEDEDKYKYSKYSSVRSKYDRERDEGKPKAEKEAFRKSDSGKPGGKPEPPPKPYDPPKIFCGPSPAMRAKLRKQSLEASKPAPVNPSFGKFTWKKKENTLLKEAQKVAAEFIKDDEAAAQQDPISPQDSFAKSMAVAKEIAQKLGSQQNMPPPWASSSTNRGRIRPNLPPPAAVVRQMAVMGKPAPLNTFLSIRPQNTASPGPPPQDEQIFPDPAPQNPPPKGGPSLPGPQTSSKPQPPAGEPSHSEAMPAPAVADPKPFEAEAKPAPPEVKPAPPDSKPAPPVSKPAPLEVNPAPPVYKPAAFEVNPAPPVSKPAPIQEKPVVSGAKSLATSLPTERTPAPSVEPTMIKMVSDVAAPGVPESEQTHTVFVKPPPFMGLTEGAPKSERPKRNLAAAKAQDLFGIFYSSTCQSGVSSITKPATDDKVSQSNLNKSQLPNPPPQKVQAQHQPPTQSQPPTVTSEQPESPGPQTEPESDLQITSVWSLQSTPAPTPNVALSKITQPAQSEAQALPQIQPSSPESESHLTPQAQPVDLEPTPPTESQPKLIPQVQTEPQSEVQLQQDLSPESESQLAPQTKPVDLEPTPPTESQPKLIPQIQAEPQSEVQLQQDTQAPSRPETDPDTTAVPEPKPGPKTRGKTSPTKRAPLAPRPVRQTRSQTRYQTRMQQQSQSEQEPEPASGDSDSTASDSKGPDSDPGLRSNPEEGAPNEEVPQMMEITPEALGLPSSLDFETDFNFD